MPLGELGLVVYFVVVGAAVVIVPFGLPGTWVQVGAAAVLAATTGGDLLRWSWVGGFGALALAGEVVELASGEWGARRFGGSRGAAWGALLGGILGALVGFPVPILGSIVMSFVGTFAGAIVGEMWARRALAPELRIGVGAVLGRVIGVAAKTGVGVTIVALSVLGILVAVRGG